MNRQQRRAEERRATKVFVTQADVDRAYKKGQKEGVKAGVYMTYKMLFAAFSLSLHDLYGFGADRCLRALNLAREKATYALTTQELMEEAYASMKLEFNFDDDATGDILFRRG